MGFFDKMKDKVRGGATLSPINNASRKIQQGGESYLRSMRELAGKSTDFQTGAQRRGMREAKDDIYKRLSQTGIGGGMSRDDRSRSFQRSRQAFEGQGALAVDPRSPGAAFQQRRNQQRSQAAAADIARRTMGADISMKRQFDAENLALANAFMRMQTAVDQRQLQNMLAREQQLMQMAERHKAERQGQIGQVTSGFGQILGTVI